MPDPGLGAVPPRCSRGHKSVRVVRAGTYGPDDHPRQMWWCHPEDPAVSKHRFAELLPRTLLHAPGHVCPSCETIPAEFEGPQHARSYELPARVIAEALVAVGGGDSYANAARQARATAKRSRSWDASKLSQTRKHRFRRRGGNGTLVADWVGALAGIVTDPVLGPERWPAVVSLDELTFGTTLSKARPGRRKEKPMWVVFGAFSHATHQGQLFRLGVSGDLGAHAAAAWLRTIPGRPKFVIADGTKVWPKAIQIAWPQDELDPETGELLDAPTLVPCQYHLARSLAAELRASGVLDPREAKNYPRPRTVRLADDEPKPHPIVAAAERAFHSAEDWDKLLATARRYQAWPLATWMSKNSWVRDSITNHPMGLPRTTGALENQLVRVRSVFHERRLVLRNQARTQLLADLITLNQRGLASTDAYAARIRTYLLDNAGRPPSQRVGITGTRGLF